MKFINTTTSESYKFKNKKLKEFYIKNCEEIWGCVPCDVEWAMATKMYRDNKPKYRVLFIHIDSITRGGILNNTYYKYRSLVHLSNVWVGESEICYYRTKDGKHLFYGILKDLKTNEV